MSKAETADCRAVAGSPLFSTEREVRSDVGRGDAGAKDCQGPGGIPTTALYLKLAGAGADTAPIKPLARKLPYAQCDMEYEVLVHTQRQIAMFKSGGQTPVPSLPTADAQGLTRRDVQSKQRLDSTLPSMYRLIPTRNCM